MTVWGIGMTKNVMLKRVQHDCVGYRNDKKKNEMLKQVQHDCEEKKRKEKENEYIT